jgi:hypothetical protein
MERQLPLSQSAVQLPTSGISPMISSILAAKIDLLFPDALPRKDMLSGSGHNVVVP